MKVHAHMLKKNSQTEPAHTIHEPTHTIHKPTCTIHVPTHEIKIHIPAPTNKIHIPHAQLKFHAPTGRISGTPNHLNSSFNTKIVLLFIGGRQEGCLDNLVDHLCHLAAEFHPVIQLLQIQMTTIVFLCMVWMINLLTKSA